jgi:uncharacterized protein YhaN
MRIRRLELQAFGPFTDKTLEFPGHGPDLHVIYGPNEAGKSSTLRALTALLYGFPERTTDNFLHPNNRLLVAGLFETGPNESIYLARRKKRKADLLDAAGNPADPGLLAALLHGIDQQVFSRLFGLDHAALVQGGSAILQEKGSAGTTLFSAGTGIVALRQILADLQQESDELYKARASKPLLNAALRQFRDLKGEIQKTSLSAREYQDHDQALRRAQQEQQQAVARRSELAREQRRLERMRQALQPLGLRRDLQAALAALGTVPELPEDFSGQRQASQERLRSARQVLADAKRRLADLRDRAEGIDLNVALLDQAETVAQLTQRLGAYRKGLADIPTLEGKRQQAATEAGRLLEIIRPDLPPERADSLRPLLRRRRGIKEDGGRLPLLEEKAETIRRRLAEQQAHRESAAQELAQLPEASDLQPLKAAISRAQGLGDIDNDLAARRRDLATRQTDYADRLKRAGLWSGNARELLALSLPLPETVERFAAEFRQLEEESNAMARRRRELAQERKQLAVEIGAIEKAGDVATEKELDEARDHRERGWQLLRRQWLQGQDIAADRRAYHAGLDLPEAYEQAVSQADGLADRLRREAERVHKYAHLVARDESVTAEQAECATRAARLEERFAELRLRWQQAWQLSGVAPLSPPEMSAWLTRLEQLRGKAGQIIEGQAQLEDLAEQRCQATRLLREQAGDAVPPAEDTALQPLLAAALERRDRAEALNSRRQRVQDRIGELNQAVATAGREADQARQALAQWHEQWRAILAELGLTGKETPGDVEDFFENLQACLSQLEKAGDYRERIAGIRRDAEALTEQVRALLQHVAPELVTLPVDQALEQLGNLCARHRAQKTRLQDCQDGIAMAEEEIRQAVGEQEAAAAQLEHLCALAGCERQEDLEQAERRWQERCRLEERIAEQEKHLRQLAEGRPLAEFEALVAQVDPDALPDRLQTLAEELEQVQQHISACAETIGMERTELARMDGGAAAADKAGQAAEKLAEVRRLAERYARLQVAARVLEDEIERYRATHQDPVLTLAGGYFAELTLGSFAGLRTDLDDKGEQVLIGLREGGARLPVEAMSDGTRDQLFLALRLASLEHRLEKSEAIPFIVDDILVNFDQQRSRATLKALKKLANRNQVILFTHHREIGDMARELEAGVISLG